jgi:type I restriction enzyme S subunit
MLSVYRDYGVVPREGRNDNYNKPGEDPGAYRVVQRGDLVLNKMKTWQGSLGISEYEGIVSPAYIVARPLTKDSPAFLHHLLRSLPLIAEYGARSKGIRPSQWDLPWDEFQNITVELPSRATQRVIADYLDRETSRLDALIAAKRRIVELWEERRISAAHATVTGVQIDGVRQTSGSPWLGSIPSHWRMARLGSLFEVQLGRMLSAERRTGAHLRRYLRNINIRWGSVDTSDLAEMDFPPIDRSRYLVRAGDLLVNEGGAGIGRAAIWNGEIDEVYYQKSVHRVRPRRYLSVRWLLEWLRVAVNRNVFEVEGNLATIPHVPAEALRQYRVPCPPEAEMNALIAALDASVDRGASARRATTKQLDLLQERRAALITAAVTGQLDIPEAA